MIFKSLLFNFLIHKTINPELENTKMKLKTLVFCGLIGLTLIGCGKPLPNEKMDYAGTWASADSRVNIVITPEGRVEYSNQQPGKTSSVSAPLTEFEGENFKAGLGPFTTEFKVTQAPKQDSQGNWFMVVDGYTLAKHQ